MGQSSLVSVAFGHPNESFRIKIDNGVVLSTPPPPPRGEKKKVERAEVSVQRRVLVLAWEGGGAPVVPANRMGLL